MTYDAFADPACWRSCQRPAWETPWPSVPFWVLAAVALALLVLPLGGPRRPRAVAVAATAAGTATVAGLAGQQLAPGPGYPPHLTAWLLAEVGVVALAGCVLVRRARAGGVSRRLRRLASELSASGAGPDDLVSALRLATGEPGLELRWWAGERGWVDEAGRPVDDAPETVVRLGDRVIAGLVGSERTDVDSLRRALGPALQLSLENAALRASQLSELAQLHESRRRIVEQGDRERRRLERNLHDGAQQRVVTLALALRLAAGEAGDITGALERACHLVEELLSSLRDIAHGVHPAALDDGGLVPAVLEHADGLRRLRVGVAPGSVEARFPASLELTAFLAVTEMLDDAERRGASVAEVRVAADGEVLVVSLRHDADLVPPTASCTAPVRERLAAFADVLRVDVDRLSELRHTADVGSGTP
jgi:signal transduction histidine kinase